MAMNVGFSFSGEFVDTPDKIKQIALVLTAEEKRKVALSEVVGRAVNLFYDGLNIENSEAII